MYKYEHEVASERQPREAGDIAVIQHDVVSAEQPGYVVGVDIGGTNLRVALADLSGTIIARHASTTATLSSPEAVIRCVCNCVRDLLTQAGAELSSLRSVAIGVPGVTDVENGIVIATSYLLGWHNVPLREIVAAELNVPIIVDNDVNMAATGESWLGSAKNARDFVFLAIGTGIGAGVVLNGKPHRGSHWAAGEIGYMLIPGIVDGPGKDSEPGVLESKIGGEGIKAQWLALHRALNIASPVDLNATEIFDRALLGDALAQIILQQTATMLAQAIYNVALVLNCPLFVVGGGVGTHPALLDAAQNVLAKWHVRGGLRLVRSGLGEDAQLIGAIRSAIDIVEAQVTTAKQP